MIHVYHESDAEQIGGAISWAGCDHEIAIVESSAALAAQLPEIEILFAADPPREAPWQDARRLRLLQMMGAGVDQLLPVPTWPATARIANARGLFAAETAEHALALMLALRRALPTFVARQQARVWRAFGSGSLDGFIACILGGGAMGTRVARATEALGMGVRVVRRTGFTRAAFDDALRGAQWLVVCVPLTAETRGLVDARALSLLANGAFVVNVARGGIIDEGALLGALESGELGGAALDVFDQEPLAPESPWWTAPNTIVTPHVAGYGLRYTQRTIARLLANVRALESGAPLPARWTSRPATESPLAAGWASRPRARAFSSAGPSAGARPSVRRANLMNAMCPSRGGRRIATPCACRRAQVA